MSQNPTSTFVRVLPDGASGPEDIPVNLTLGNTFGDEIPRLDDSGNPVIGPDGMPEKAPILLEAAEIRIPEPGSLSLAVIGLISFRLTRRRGGTKSYHYHSKVFT